MFLGRASWCPTPRTVSCPNYLPKSIPRKLSSMDEHSEHGSYSIFASTNRPFFLCFYAIFQVEDAPLIMWGGHLLMLIVGCPQKNPTHDSAFQLHCRVDWGVFTRHSVPGLLFGSALLCYWGPVRSVLAILDCSAATSPMVTSRQNLYFGNVYAMDVAVYYGYFYPRKKNWPLFLPG